jgi:hypothetical protein
VAELKTDLPRRNKVKMENSKFKTPASWRKEIERVLISEEQIARRIKILAREIERDFRGREMVVVSLLNGTVCSSPI